MPKRKRDSSSSSSSSSSSPDALFSRHRAALSQALKTAKGFERQRQSKRLSDPRTDAAKRARLENEIAVLKSLDLSQTAHAHLCSALLRARAVAALPPDRLPAPLRAGVPRPELTPEERAALHNVTSSLLNRAEVRAVADKAVAEVCKALGVEAPRRGRGRGGDEKGEARKKAGGDKTAEGGAGAKSRELGRERGPKGKTQPVEEVDQEQEEKALSELDKLLGLDSEEEDSDDEDTLVKGRAKKPTRELDPMEITTDEEDDSGDDLDPMEVTSDEEDGYSDEFHGFSDDEGQQSSASDDASDASDAESSASSTSRSPRRKRAAKDVKPLSTTDSMFLPTLMGGYISGSESASDVDMAPARKNRRGQRARQAIWEKKFGEKAKHLHQPAKGRDAGWDLKRGAVEGSAKPWKRGIRNPLQEKAGAGGNARAKGSGANERRPGPPKKEKAPRTRDDSGPLHPSWEAKRLAKEKMLTAPFQGKKITFD